MRYAGQLLYYFQSQVFHIFGKVDEVVHILTLDEMSVTIVSFLCISTMYIYNISVFIICGLLIDPQYNQRPVELESHVVEQCADVV